MPQLDFSTYSSQIFWLVISFSLLYFILCRFALPGIRDVLQNRQTRIASDLKRAEQLKCDAEQAQGDFTSVLSDARQKASQAMAEVKAELAKKEEERNTELDKKFAAQAKELDSKVANFRKDIAPEMDSVIEEYTISILDKIAGIKTSKSKVGASIKKATKI